MMIRGKIVCWNILWKEKNKSNSLRIENNANIGNSVLNVEYLLEAAGLIYDKDTSLKWHTKLLQWICANISNTDVFHIMS